MRKAQDLYKTQSHGKNIVNSFYYLRTSAGLLEFKKTPCYNNFIQMPEA